MTDATSRLNAALEGRYAIERKLGEGGMAVVYLARDLRHNRSVALKVLKPELAAVLGGQRFLAEIETTANLQHPHVLPLFDSGEADGFLFYVMPYVEGESLRERLDREKQLPVEEAVRIATNVAEALQYAHAHGVIHRDIKPANILLQSGKPVISDFGIALAVGAAGGGRLTETGLSLGTPHYMSPEQATGDVTVGGASDIYALGCVLYEMLAGEPPFVGSTAQAVLGRIVTGDADPVTKHRRAVPPNVDGAVRRALERVPADRFASAADFARALAEPGYRYGGAEALGAGRDGARWKHIAIACAVLFAMSATGLGWALLRSDPPALVARFEDPFRPDQMPQGAMEFTPDGSALVYIGPNASGPGNQLWIRRWDDPDATPIAGTEGVFSTAYLEISPDGREVAFPGPAEAGYPLLVAPLGGGPPRQIGPSTRGVHGWTSEGTVYFQDWEDGAAISRVSASGGSTREVVTEVTGQEGAHDALRILPGGRMAVITVYFLGQGAVGTEIWKLDLETGERSRLTEGMSPRYASSGHLLFVRPDGMLMAAPIDESANLGPAVAVAGGIQVVSGVAQYAVSSRGTLVYVREGRGEASSSLLWVDREGREESLPLERQRYVYPRISHDGTRVAVAVVEEGADLWVFDLDRLSRSRITYGGDNRYFPVWSPSGDELVFADGPNDGNALLRAAADGSGRTDTLLARDGAQFPASWSRDGRFLAFYERDVDRPENGRDLWVLPFDGEPQMFLATPFQERAPAFSPDGRWLAYASSKSGRDEVYMRPFPGPGPEVVLSTGGGTEPVWSAEGTELFYRSPDRMMVVDLSDPTSPTPPRPLWEDPYLRDPSNNAARNYDVHPDGDRFLMVRLHAAEPNTVTVVLNWYEELRRLTGG